MSFLRNRMQPVFFRPGGGSGGYPVGGASGLPVAAFDAYKASLQDNSLSQKLATLDALNVLARGPVVNVQHPSFEGNVAAAVAYAYAGNTELYWPAGTYESGESIPNFHDVRHSGPGRVTRGGGTFYISPTNAQTNNLYVSTTGNDTNDGLSSGYAFRTVQHAVDVLQAKGARLPGKWRITLAAGTYTENVDGGVLTEGEDYVEIKGPAAGHPNVPTAIIQASDTAGDVLSFSTGGYWRITDVKLTGATTGNGVVNNQSFVVLTNVHISGCLTAVEGLNLAYTKASGGIWTGTGKTVVGGHGYQSFYNAIHTIQGTSAGTGTQISEYETGLLINEGAQGHLDYTQVSDCTYGVLHKRGAGACNTSHMSIKRCTVGYFAQCGWFNNNIEFGTGADANTTNVLTSGDAPEFLERADTVKSITSRIVSTIRSVTHTGTVAKTTVWALQTIKDWMLGASPNPTPAPVASIDAYIQTTLTGNCTLYLSLGGTDIVSAVIPSTVTAARVQIELLYSETAGQRANILVSHAAGNIIAYAATAVTTKNVELALELRATLSASGDSLVIRQGRFSTTVGG